MLTFNLLTLQWDLYFIHWYLMRGKDIKKGNWGLCSQRIFQRFHKKWECKVVILTIEKICLFNGYLYSRTVHRHSSHLIPVWFCCITGHRVSAGVTWSVILDRSWPVFSTRTTSSSDSWFRCSGTSAGNTSRPKPWSCPSLGPCFQQPWCSFWVSRICNL